MKDGAEVVPDNVHVKEIRSPDGSVALLIDNCKPEDAGKYSLTAKNPLGETSSSGKLGVSGKESDSPPRAPCFVSPIGNLTVKEGEPIRFEAQISGNPLPDIAWTVNDRPLTPSDNTLITFDGEKAILEIRSSTPDHIGTYQCKLSNPLGDANSEGSVSVQEKTAPHFIQRLNDFNGFVDQPLRLSCKVTGYPEPEVDWYFNGDLISNTNPKYNLGSIGETHTLSISSCRPVDNGVFECKAKNPVGEDHTRSAVNISDKVERGEAPMFLKKIGDNEVMEGMTAKFTACITGTPTPEVSWFKDGQPLEPSSRHKMELESTGILRLIVREVEEGDYGTYSVTLTNSHGTATCSAKICPDSKQEILLEFLTPQRVALLAMGIIGALAFLIALLLPPEFYCSPEG
ncbi:obscurin, partial [Nephila pilipes]